MTGTRTKTQSVLLCVCWSGWVLPVFADGCGDGALAQRNEDDDGNDCSSSSLHHSHTSTASTPSGSSTTIPLDDTASAHGGVGRGGIAGIILGIILGLLLLLLLLLFLRRRSRQRQTRLSDGGDAALMTADHEQKGDGTHSSVDSGYIPRTYANIPPSSNILPRADSTTIPLVAAGIMNQHGRGGSETHHRHSTSITSLPNPYDEEESSPSHDIRNRDLPPTPDPLALHDLGSQRTSTAFSAASSSSPPPSSFFDPITALTRGPTSSTTASRASVLHSEMTAYQKELEAHHEKEMQVRDDVGGSNIPLEPPPEYREQLPSASTSDLGEISHGSQTH